MRKYFFVFGFMVYSVSLFAQKDLVDGFVVTYNNDTIYGKLVDRKYFTVSKVSIYGKEGKKKVFPRSGLKLIQVGSDKYVNGETDGWAQLFFKKDEEGSVNLYSFRRKKLLGAYDKDINDGGLKQALMFYCDDYPNLVDSLDKINRDNVKTFIKKYNSWKTGHISSRSFFESNIHAKPSLNVKISFFLPGAGIELGLSDKVSMSSLIKNGFGYSAGNWYIDPFIDSQLRFYVNVDQRKKANKRTYKYSGNYLSFAHFLFINGNIQMIGFLYGWQRTSGRQFYNNFAIGVGQALGGYSSFPILVDWDFGYNF